MELSAHLGIPTWCFLLFFKKKTDYVVQAGEELCIYYGPDGKLWFDYPRDPEDADEDDEGAEGEGGGQKNLATLEGALSPEAFAALRSHLDDKKDAQEE